MYKTQLDESTGLERPIGRPTNGSPDTTRRQAAHSPLPWSADKWATGYTVSATDHSVCHLQDCNNEEANARLIVASVNHANKLAEELRQVLRHGSAGNENHIRQALSAYDKAKGDQ